MSVKNLPFQRTVCQKEWAGEFEIRRLADENEIMNSALDAVPISAADLTKRIFFG